MIFGVVGLSRFEWMPVVYKKNSNLSDHKAEHETMVAAMNAGVTEVLIEDEERAIGIQTVSSLIMIALAEMRWQIFSK